jgi:general secretion pathway protein A
MYEQFYDLRERAFDLMADSRFLCLLPNHVEALSSLKYALQRPRGIALLLGDAGTGKTTLTRAAIADMPEPRGAVIYLSNPTLTRNEFVEFLALSLGLSEGASHSKGRFVLELERHLAARKAVANTTALVIDEAQSLPDEILEEIRLLGNMEAAGDRLLTIVLVGQPELGERLNRPSLRQLKQRVAQRCLLPPLDAREVPVYIATRLEVAGGEASSVFTDDAITIIGQASGGIPRVISIMCENALVTGFALNERPVGRSTVMEVCRDFQLAGFVPASRQAMPPALDELSTSDLRPPLFDAVVPSRRRLFSWS